MGHSLLFIQHVRFNFLSGLNYPKRDPALKDNWRGKIRSENVSGEVVDYSPSFECNGGDASDEDDVQWNGQALKMAISRGASFWRSHGDSRFFQFKISFLPNHYVTLTIC